MENLLSIITFVPLAAAAILALILRGDDAAANRNAKWVALTATTAMDTPSGALCTPVRPARNPSITLGGAPTPRGSFSWAS